MALRLTAETIDSGVVSGTLSRKIVGEVEISSRARGNSTWRSARFSVAALRALARAVSFGSRYEHRAR